MGEYGVAVTITLIVFFILLLTGHYISTVLFSAGIIGLSLIGGMKLTGGFLLTDPMTNMSSYSLSTIPLYIIMANFLMKADLFKDFYAIVYKLSRGKRGTLGVLTLLLGGFLGAVSGSGTATSASLGQVSSPELRKRGYSEGLAGAISAAAGSLSAIVPPSNMIIMYGITAQVSIAILFQAAFLPGALCMVAFIIAALFFLKRDQMTPQQIDEELEKQAEYVEHITTKRIVFVVCSGAAIVITIFGGIFSGFFTPTEAGAVATVVALIIAVLGGKMSVSFMINSIMDAMKTTGMCLMMSVAASLFSRFVTRSMVPRAIISLMEPLMDKPQVVLVLMILLYFILFMLLDGMATILMTVPIFLPLMQAIGVDGVWFGIVICLLLAIGTLTPPVGMCVYAVSGVTGTKSSTLFSRAFPMAAFATAVCGLVLVCYPNFVWILPNLLAK